MYFTLVIFSSQHYYELIFFLFIQPQNCIICIVRVHYISFTLSLTPFKPSCHLWTSINVPLVKHLQQQAHVANRLFFFSLTSNQFASKEDLVVKIRSIVAFANMKEFSRVFVVSESIQFVCFLSIKIMHYQQYYINLQYVKQTMDTKVPLAIVLNRELSPNKGMTICRQSTTLFK